MSPHLQHLISNYGYWVMAFAALIEGETFLIAGGIAVQQGLLNLPVTIALAMFGSMLHDCSFFFLGRYAGSAMLKKWPKLAKKSEHVLTLFNRYGVFLIIAFRFAYGIRTIVPTVMGMSRISVKRFVFFDAFGGLLWACTFVFAGYIFGSGLTLVLHRVAKFEKMIIHVAIILVIVFAIGLMLHSALKFFQNKRKS